MELNPQCGRWQKILITCMYTRVGNLSHLFCWIYHCSTSPILIFSQFRWCTSSKTNFFTISTLSNQTKHNTQRITTRDDPASNADTTHHAPAVPYSLLSQQMACTHTHYNHHLHDLHVPNTCTLLSTNSAEGQQPKVRPNAVQSC